MKLYRYNTRKKRQMSITPFGTQLTFLADQARIPSAARLFLVAAVTVVKWDRYHKTRKSLKRLERHQLEDVGLCRQSADFEAAKPFWKD
jgi:uncharacterized protein YjiS (DUF1127 family)